MFSTNSNNRQLGSKHLTSPYFTLLHLTMVFVLSSLFSSRLLAQSCGEIVYETTKFPNGNLEIGVIYQNYSGFSTAFDFSIIYNIQVGNLVLDAVATQSSLGTAGVTPSGGGTNIVPSFSINTATQRLDYAIFVNTGTTFTINSALSPKKLFTLKFVPKIPGSGLTDCVFLQSFARSRNKDGSLNISSTDGPVRYRVIDPSNPTTFCPVTYPTQPYLACGDVPSISGGVYSPTPLPECNNSTQKIGIKSVNIAVTDVLGKTYCNPPGIMTGNNGEYQTCVLAPSQNYTLTASKGCDTRERDRCGVSTYDIVLINQSFLGYPLKYAWQYIAADVNNNGTVDIDDIAVLKKRIFDTAPLSKCWDFFPTNSTVLTSIPPNMTNGSWSQAYTPVFVGTSKVPNIDFIGIKKGDVNGNCYCNQIGRPNNSGTSNSSSTIATSNQRLKAGKIFNIPLYLGEAKTISAFDISLDINPKLLKINAVSSSLPSFDEDSYTINNDEGKVRIIWINNREPITLEAASTLFYVQVETLENIDLKQAIKFSDSEESLVFENNGEEQKAILQIDEQIKWINSSTATSFGNTLQINAEEKEEGELWIYNTMGQLLIKQKIDLYLGNNMLNIKGILPESTNIGLYPYLLKTNKNQYYGKVIIKQ